MTRGKTSPNSFSYRNFSPCKELEQMESIKSNTWHKTAHNFDTWIMFLFFFNNQWQCSKVQMQQLKIKYPQNAVLFWSKVAQLEDQEELSTAQVGFVKQ